MNTFEKKYEAARPKMIAYASKIAGYNEAEDIVQTAGIKVWSKIQEGNIPMKDFPKYMTTAVRNTAINVYRKKIRENEVYLNGHDQPVIPTGMQEDIWKEIRKHVSLEEWEVIELRCEDKRYKEIAKILNIPLGTALRRFNTAKKRIQKAEGIEDFL